ncbi:hypothetical protein TrVE_jg9982 [Triparma verrucosa]|uniref:U3 small nucleolar RNA-associated protein 6 N-terminal domain-containing protein n=1 Tax=Triparma verrucosa TaxID=1606542 RepID=A0A9W7FC49_9STRA|nr:hypothetical protein TrVE_jg9982 [Triparma verrucosa]
MADAVQQVMDTMVPALRDLADKQIFNEREIKGLVNKRREFEYLLRRQAVRKSDFLLYLTFELNLLKLYTLRVSKLKKTSSSPSDHHIEQHIHLIFRRGLRKFKSDLNFWMQYIDFCKKNESQKKLSSIYAEALQIHPKDVSLWLSAASWEYFSNSSIKNARTLLQRSLRVNSTSPNLYVEYFKLELHYIQKLRGRREILQLDGVKSKKMMEDETFSGAVPMIIFDQAIEKINDDVEFRFKFLEACSTFPQTEKIESHILSSLEHSSFKTNVSAYIARASWLLNTSISSSLKVLNSGLSNCPGPEIHEEVLIFMSSLVTSNPSLSPHHLTYINSAKKLNAKSPKLIRLISEYKILKGQYSETKNFILKEIDNDRLKSPETDTIKLYDILASICYKLSDETSGIAVLEKGLNSISWGLNDSKIKGEYVQRVIEYMLISGLEDKVQNILKKIELPSIELGLRTYLRYVISENKPVKDIYEYVVNEFGGGSYCINFFRDCLDAETEIISRRRIWESIVQAEGGGEGGRNVKRVLEEWERDEEEEGEERMAKIIRIRKSNVVV